MSGDANKQAYEKAFEFNQSLNVVTVRIYALTLVMLLRYLICKWNHT
jgi:hypothetical protein